MADLFGLALKIPPSKYISCTKYEDFIYLTNYEKNKITVLLTSDLSSAFDCIDHKILAKKLEYYNFKGNELKLMKSYLSGWKQFVEVDTKRSKLINSLPYSVIQGSKLSGLLYNIYTNEIPLLQNILRNKDYFKKITGLNLPPLPKVDHQVINFVDDR